MTTAVEHASGAGARRSDFVRPLRADDVPAVASLFQQTFRDPRTAPSADLTAYFGELFLHHPWYDEEIASRVHVAPDGSVDGFVGVLPMRMQIGDRAVRAAFAGSLMVKSPATNPLAGARLLRALLSGPQEVSLSETANPLSRQMWMRLGGKTLPTYSMEWVRVFRPAGFGVEVAAQANRAAGLLRPFARAADGVLGRLKRNPLRLAVEARPRHSGVDVTLQEFSQYVRQLGAELRFHPAWDAETLGWVLAHAARKPRYGKPCFRVVMDSRGSAVGCAMYFVRPGGIAWVLQVLAATGASEPVIDDLLAHVAAMGAVAVRGRSHPMLLDALMRRGCIFLHRSSAVVHCRDMQLLACIEAGDAFITGLAAETWIRLHGDF